MSDKTLVSLLVFTANGDGERVGMIQQLEGRTGFEIHRINANLSSSAFYAAVNRRLAETTGEYVMFACGNDSISVDNLKELCNRASLDNLDLVWVSPICGTPPLRLSKHLPQQLSNRTLNGEECLAALIKATVYVPSLYGHLFRRDWIMTNEFRFEEEQPYPAELWMQEAFCRTTRMMVSDSDVYFHSDQGYAVCNVDDDEPHRAVDLFQTADRLLGFADRYSFDEKERILKSWLCANALRVYYSACRIVTAIRTHDCFKLPPHRLHTFKNVMAELEPEAAEYCRRYYKLAAALEQEYIIWKDNPCDPIISGIPQKELQSKRIILVYNNPSWQEYSEILKNLPEGYILTLDRKYMDRAFAVVFHMPGLNEHLSSDLCKPDGQVWIRWNMEPETKFSWMENPELDELFDLRMDYHPDADLVCPYYAGFKPERVATPVDPLGKKNRVCMLISSGVNQSGRKEYLAELMKHTRVDSYGRLYHNTDMEGEDRGWNSKVALYSQYKFVIAFENSVLEDYVTEKLYDPLYAGTVPVYLGAPNVEDYLPGADCVIRADRFGSPKELAEYIERCYAEDEEYLRYYQWRSLPWRDDFVRKEAIQDNNPFVRLCWLLDEKCPRN